MVRKSTAKPQPSLPGQISLFGPRETPDAFRKAVQAVHSKPKSPLSLVQRKLGNAWLKHAIETPPDERGWWQLGIMDLAESIAFDSNNRKHLKESAKALMSIVFEWDVLAPPNKRVPWKASVLFPEIEIDSDVIRYQISSEMRERMINPDMYALIDMNIVRRFRRASSLGIWEFCVRFEKIGVTAAVEWEKFRDMMLGESAEAKTYREYKYFKSKALTPSIAEINAESNHTITLIETKVGKKIATLQFEIRKKNIVSEVAEDESSVELISELVRFGVPQSEAKRLCATNDAAKIKNALEYTKRRIADKKQTKIDNPAAYFRQALAQGYAGETRSAVEVHNAEEASQRGRPKRQAVDIKEEYRSHQILEAERYFKELDAPDQAKCIEKYNAGQATNVLRLNKKPSKAAQAAFFGWLATETWGEPTSDELLDFAQSILLSR